MTEGSGGTRWWENYLVRYFLPSLAGMLIVLWLVRFSGASPYIPQFLPSEWNDFGTAHLILWLLLGSLYCYLASYPALVFHATRILDFRNVEGQIAKWPYWCLNPYLWSVVFTIFVGILARINAEWCAACAVLLVFLFSALQISRIWLVFSSLGCFGLDEQFNAKRDASIAYAYLRTLSDRRGISNEEGAASSEEKDKDHEEKQEKATTIKDAKDFVDSYRHLREHGNTAFIVLLEIALCSVLYLVLGNKNNSTSQSELMFFLVLVLWVLPSVLIHGLAQHLERRFSWFDFSIENRRDNSSERKSGK